MMNVVLIQQNNLLPNSTLLQPLCAILSHAKNPSVLDSLN